MKKIIEKIKKDAVWFVGINLSMLILLTSVYFILDVQGVELSLPARLSFFSFFTFYLVYSIYNTLKGDYTVTMELKNKE